MSVTVKAAHGFGQVEPNHLSAQRTSQIYAQLPANAEIETLENGQYVKYDYAKHEVNFEGAGEWMMVFNEVKLYDDRWRESYKDFAMQKKNYDYGIMTPRVIKTNIGDIYTTNTVKKDIEWIVGSMLTPGKTGILEDASEQPGTTPGKMIWQVVEETTMPDGNPAVKVMRVQ